MKKSITATITLLFLLLPLAFAQEYNTTDDSWIYRSSYLLLNTRMQVGVDIQAIADDSYVESLEGIMTFYPRETPEQRLLDTDYRPEPKETEDGLAFSWKEPKLDKIFVIIESRIRIENDPPRITKKAPFPITNIPQNIRFYTREAEIIDINDDIIKLASSLAEGEDDLAVVVDNIAAWVTKNVQYNLTTVTAEASQKASWVLRNKEGVCDELTSLFIAMLRSLNIPARFVAGISYTNSPLFEQKWGPHGWAEVYFPSYGWIPYDVTYGEYGYADPTHIVAKYAVDAGKISTKFSWRARNVDVDVLPFTTNVRVVEYGKELLPRIAITVELLKDSVGFGSYNLVEATIENLVNYYQPIDVHLSRTSNMEVLDPYKQHLLLKPNEVRKVFWRVRVAPDLQENYLYTFPLLIYTLGNVSAKTEFMVVADGAMVSEARINEEMQERRAGEAKALARSLDIQCTSDKEGYYADEVPKVSCTFSNTGNVLLEDVRLCHNSACQTEDIGITQQKLLAFDYALTPDSPNDIVVTAKNHDVNERRLISLQVKDLPTINVTNLQYPHNVSYEDVFHILFTLRKTSRTSPKNVQTTLALGTSKTPFTLDSLEGEQVYDVTAAGKDMLGEQNEFQILAKWEDDLGRSYETTQQFAIALNKPTFWQQLKVWFSAVGDRIASVFA
ncbi:transglutaminase domain-containing protein [Candidatus Woesearchaeota archaeon]|nr:transglutaminase domain-containing protein [Candidatus Woesearchaeota archaeon]